MTNPDAGSASDIPPFRYTAVLADEIENRWQDYWEEHGTFHSPNPTGPLADPAHPRAGAEKLFVLDMFPYPSGAGLHVGHPLGYIGTDCYGRYELMAGRNVLHAMGFDAFGLPAEQYAVQTGQHPRKTTEANVARYRASCAGWPNLRRSALRRHDGGASPLDPVDLPRSSSWRCDPACAKPPDRRRSRSSPWHPADAQGAAWPT
jgi:hypothetical protein